MNWVKTSWTDSIPFFFFVFVRRRSFKYWLYIFKYIPLITCRSRFIAIAPKPGQGENKNEEQENDPGCLVIDENSEPTVNSLPANIKEQLKTGRALSLLGPQAAYSTLQYL